MPFPAAAVDGSVGDRFLEVAGRFGDRPALRSPSGAWTYAELAEAVTDLAAGVQEALGTGPAQPVAVLAAHDGPLVVAILGVITAGHVVVVVDPTAPPPHGAHVMAESGATIVLHDEANAAAAQALAHQGGPGCRAVALDEVLGPRFSPPTLGPDAPAMLAFTSGTSGAPKAAIVTHGVLTNLVRGATNALGVGPDDRMPMLFPASLAVAAYPLFIPLLNGATLATLDVRSVGLEPVADFLAGEHITLAYMAPTVVRFLVDALAGRSFPHLRLIALGGEVVDGEVLRLTAELFGPELIANGFGTTETGVVTLYVTSPYASFDGAVPAGHPVDDVDLFVLDDAGQPVDPGVAGEVAVASPYLFAGYWRHPEITDRVLSEDPDGRPGWRLYRTGDLGRLDPSGALTVLGRLDTKVKVRGRFVVLGDVEADLHTVADVVDAGVVAVTHEGTTELAAVVTLAPDSSLSALQLRAALLDRLEAYRVPTRWSIVAELPRLPNGKVDRQALAHVAETGSSPPTDPDLLAGAGDAESDERQRITREVRELWELLLPVEEVGLDDDFEHLGGHSLLAAQMLVLLEQRSGTLVPMSALVDNRTVRALAEVIAAIRAADDDHPSTAARVQAGHADRPMLWFVPDLPGSAYRVRRVATALGGDQPVWSFESPLLRGEPNHFTRLDTFVARLVCDLRQVQPTGPYWLCGYSFGGICAYQMARELEADGHEVAFVGVIDVGPGYRGPNWRGSHSPPWPFFGVPDPPAPGTAPADIVRHYADMAKRSPVGFARHLTLLTGLARYGDRLRFAADLRRHGRVRPEWRLWYAWEEHWKLASKAWDRTNRYPGRVDLFWAGLTGSTDGTMGWGPLVDDLHIHRFDGFHDDLLEEKGAPAVGAVLRAQLDAAIARRATEDGGP